MANFSVGGRVQIVRRGVVLGHGVIAKIGARKTVLEDGSEWRTADGYTWGAKPTRGLGFRHERRIVVVG